MCRTIRLPMLPGKLVARIQKAAYTPGMRAFLAALPTDTAKQLEADATRAVTRCQTVEDVRALAVAEDDATGRLAIVDARRANTDRIVDEAIAQGRIV